MRQVHFCERAGTSLLQQSDLAVAGGGAWHSLGTRIGAWKKAADVTQRGSVSPGLVAERECSTRPCWRGGHLFGAVD